MRSNNSACKASWAFLEDWAALDFRQALESLEGSGPVLLFALDTFSLVGASVEESFLAQSAFFTG